MKAANVHPDGAADVEIRPEKRVLLGRRNCIGVDAKRLAQRFRLAGEPLVLAGCARSGEAARQREVAVDALVRDEAIEVLARGLGLRLYRQRPLGTETPRKLGGFGAEITAGNSPIARRRPLPWMLPVEDVRRTAGASESDRRAQAGVSGPDDRNVGGGRNRGLIHRFR